jgi:hypothetical protein
LEANEALEEAKQQTEAQVKAAVRGPDAAVIQARLRVEEKRNDR